VEIAIPAPGRHIAHDATGALAVAVALGVDPRAAARQMSRYEPVGMRLRREEVREGIVALNDAYNANPDSTKASLAVLAGLGGRRVAVLGDLLELGADEAMWHQRVATHATGLGLDLVVLVGERMSKAARPSATVWTFEDAEDAVAPLSAWLRPGDTVLFKGSRGARVERVLHGLRGEVRD
jgi:UDP-N-acetylmuramoyl-tripeptide--D-alanyl-D-alanine ligase